MPDSRVYYRCKHCGRIFRFDSSVPSQELVSKEEEVAAVLADAILPAPNYLCFNCETLDRDEDSFLGGGGDL